MWLRFAFRRHLCSFQRFFFPVLLLILLFKFTDPSESRHQFVFYKKHFQEYDTLYDLPAAVEIKAMVSIKNNATIKSNIVCIIATVESNFPLENKIERQANVIVKSAITNDKYSHKIADDRHSSAEKSG